MTITGKYVKYWPVPEGYIKYLMISDENHIGVASSDKVVYIYGLK